MTIVFQAKYSKKLVLQERQYQQFDNLFEFKKKDKDKTKNKKKNRSKSNLVCNDFFYFLQISQHQGLC